jgi:glycine cleavage system aminomethyltransferase T
VSLPVRRSPVARLHAALGGTLESEAGWELVGHYGDPAGERTRLREGVALADVTARGKVDVRGAIDGVLRASGDALAARVAEDWALVLAEPGGEGLLLATMSSAAGAGSMVTDATHLLAGFALGGPELPGALSRLTSWDPASLAPGQATGAPVGEVRALVVRRDLEVPLLEVYVGSEFARYAWETFLDAVRRSGGAPVGWRALRAAGWS